MTSYCRMPYVRRLHEPDVESIMLTPSARSLFGESFIESRKLPVGSTITQLYARADKFDPKAERKIRDALGLNDTIRKLTYFGINTPPRGYYIGHGWSLSYQGRYQQVILQDAVREENHGRIPVFRFKRKKKTWLG